MNGFGEMAIVAIITGFFATIGASFGFKYKLNSVIEDQRKLKDDIKMANMNAEKARETSIQHAERLKEIETRCKILHRRKSND